MVAGHYSHRQTGWVIIATSAVSLGIASVMLFSAKLVGLGIFTLALLCILLLLFHSLTVSVQPDTLMLKLGVGLLKKRVPLQEIRFFSRMRSRWYYGFGIRVTPRGVLYNVSGLDAVQLVLKSGKRLCIGTDEPDELLKALERSLGTPAPLSPEEQSASSAGARSLWLTASAGVTLLLVGLCAALYLEGRPPSFEISEGELKIDSFIYGERMPLAALTSVELTQSLPPIRARTNGYAVGNTLRGHFRLDDLGDGQLFVDLDAKPFVLVRTEDRYVVFNFADKAQTRKSFIQLSSARLHQQRTQGPQAQR